MPVQDIRIPTLERAAVDPEFRQEMLSLAQELEREGFSEVAHSLRTELAAYSPERAGTAVRPFLKAEPGSETPMEEETRKSPLHNSSLAQFRESLDRMEQNSLGTEEGTVAQASPINNPARKERKEKIEAMVKEAREVAEKEKSRWDALRDDIAACHVPDLELYFQVLTGVTAEELKTHSPADFKADWPWWPGWDEWRCGEWGAREYRKQHERAMNELKNCLLTTNLKATERDLSAPALLLLAGLRRLPTFPW